MASKRIDSEVLRALASVEWDGKNAVLSCGQLDRKVYIKTNEVLETLGGKWNKKAKAHVFEDEQRDALEAVIETGEFVSGIDLKKAYGEFETPDALADVVVEAAEIEAGHTILEPSAGSGQLIKAIIRRHGSLEKHHVAAVEIQEKRQSELIALGARVAIRDFLEFYLVYSFDRIVMNPPFARQADVDHVTKAWSLLKPGGRLVAIMSPSWSFRENRKSRGFRRMIDLESDWSITKNPEGSFRAAGTNVNTVMLVMDKPVDNGA